MRRSSARQVSGDPIPSRLLCNDLENPLGADTPVPRLSWRMSSETRGQRQTAYRILVSGSYESLRQDIGDAWDSGRVESPECVGIPYRGTPLQPRREYYWKVRQWDKDGVQGSWSPEATFETGLLDEFKGQWIAPSGHQGPENPSPAPMMRTVLNLPGRVRRGRVYLCGLGFHELYVNGVRIGDGLLAPAVSRYDRHVEYETFDVTGFLLPGENILGVILGNGFFNCFTKDAWNFRSAAWRARPRMWMEGHFEFEDGSEITEVSGSHWKSATGPIIADALRSGETYDARLERPGWSAPGYDDRDFLPAQVVRPPGGERRSQQHPPIRVTGTLTAVSVKEAGKGVWIYDFGQNISGFIHMEAPGFKDAKITFRYSELLDEKGRIDRTEISEHIYDEGFQTDCYFMRGDPGETWEPRFAYHGFRYVEVTGYPGEHGPKLFKARVVHTDLPVRGGFQCSNDTLNAIQRCAVWSSLTNYHGIPTDCPHREKNGWTGDAQLSSEQMLINFDPRAAYRKWLRDMADAQWPDGQLPAMVPTGGWGYTHSSGPAWNCAVIIIPWNQYVYTGDLSILEENYLTMVRYLDFLALMETGGIVDFGLGDWCPPGRFDAYKSPVAVTDTAYYHTCARLLSRISAVLGRESDAKRFETLAGRIRDSFRREFVVSNDGTVTGNCQTSLACALYQGMINPEEEGIFLTSLLEEIERCGRHIDCGILGSKYVMHVLADMGRADVAFDIAVQPSYPGWGDWIQRGATTLWESWGGADSHNHHAFSDISAFFYRGLAGIRPDPGEPGFRHVILRPRTVGDLLWVNAWHESPYGRIVSNWRIEKGALIYNCVLPPGTRGTLTLPSVRGGPEIRKAPRDSEGRPVMELDSGKYMFRCDL